MITLPKSFETTLLAHLKKTYLGASKAANPWNAKDVWFFSKGVAALNRSYTVSRATRHGNYFNDPVMRSGYLAYYLPVNAMKAYQIFSRFETVENKTEIRIADIGAGPLSMSLGLIFALIEKIAQKGVLPRKMILSIDAYEQNKKILSDGVEILNGFLKKEELQSALEVRVKQRVGDLNRFHFPKEKYDVILCGNLLNEYDKREDQWHLVKQMIASFCQKDTWMFFLEPASKKVSRDLQQLRDTLIEKTDLAVLAPCLHQKTCPLNLVEKADWCHFQQNWQTPDFIQEFDKLLDQKKSYLLYSYLLMRQGKALAPVRKTNEFVAITDLMKEKGSLEIVGCGPAGRVRFIRFSSDESENNANFSRLLRGMKFSIENYHDTGIFELNLKVCLKKKDRVNLP